jgi:hypothetical protein
MAIAFFMLFPRGFLVGGLRLPTTRPGDNATLLDTVMDPTKGASANSRRILFQVQGERVGYLHCYPLAEFDGQRWNQGEDYRWRNLSTAALDEHAAGTLHRRVRVKNPAFLGRVVPVDGEVLAVRGSFFRSAYQTRQGMIGADYMAAGPINVYEYWIASNPPPARLRFGEVRQLTNHPALSPRLKTWLEQVLAGRTNQYEQARFLEQYLGTHFTYQLGAPDLNRINPTEDFLLNQKTGHCERFASALAVLLRELGIPSRVIIGYLPRRSHLSSDWMDVRLRDAHSWTEAWFPASGWVSLDATPAASLPPPTAWNDWLEALDFAWYAHVVNYDAPTQNALLRDGMQQAQVAAYWVWSNQIWILLLATAALLLVLWRNRRAKTAGTGQADEAQRQAQILAGHCYGKMLRALARQGRLRPPHQTPLEFLQSLRALTLPNEAEIEAITLAFCATRYGLRILSAMEQQQLEEALQKIESTPP